MIQAYIPLSQAAEAGRLSLSLLWAVLSKWEERGKGGEEREEKEGGEWEGRIKGKCRMWLKVFISEPRKSSLELCRKCPGCMSTRGA